MDNNNHFDETLVTFNKSQEGGENGTSPTLRKRKRVRLTQEQIQEASHTRRQNQIRASRFSDNSNEDHYARAYTPRDYSHLDEERREESDAYRERYHQRWSQQRQNTQWGDNNDHPSYPSTPRPHRNDLRKGKYPFKKSYGNGESYPQDNRYTKPYNGPKKGRDQQNKKNPPFSKQRAGVPPQKKKVINRPTYEFQDQLNVEPCRLNKYLAKSGVCSRREADELIKNSAVLVNGIPVTELGVKVLPTDQITVNNRTIIPESKVYVLLNKPRNCVTTTDDPEERFTVMHLVKRAGKERIYPVGRLDRNTTGVLLLTNDGDLAAKLVHPKYKKKKIYHVWLDKEISPEEIQKLLDGVELEDGEMYADAISYVTEDDRTQVGIEIHSGKNRIVRRLFEHIGYRVVKLDRVYFAGLTKKNLGKGKWRFLTQQEVDMLRMGAFE